jgi:hypothetical protein
VHEASGLFDPCPSKELGQIAHIFCHGTAQLRPSKPRKEEEEEEEEEEERKQEYFGQLFKYSSASPNTRVTQREG